MTFAGKAALVTGGASGIGRAAALSFARQGARVAVADIDEGGAQAVAGEIEAAGGQALALHADVTQEADVAAMVARAAEAFGRLDCAFNNAGIEEEHAPLADAAEALFDRIMAVNVKGVWRCMRHEIRQMLRQGGPAAIVNTASVAGLGGAPTMSAYAASKHAVLGLTRSAALEYAGAGIRINAVCPAVIRTPMYERAIAAEPRRKERIERMHPIGRIGEAQEIADAVLFLCSEQAGFVVGHAFAIDGGLTAA